SWRKRIDSKVVAKSVSAVVVFSIRLSIIETTSEALEVKNGSVESRSNKNGESLPPTTTNAGLFSCALEWVAVINTRREKILKTRKNIDINQQYISALLVS
ncbi:MAG TPA: hypothetical protein DCQ88_05440, partial [Acidimicrobiaceae bacterium]|nr:hypothetical protein [Acidimicrobiaceae bacterium]